MNPIIIIAVALKEFEIVSSLKSKGLQDIEYFSFQLKTHLILQLIY